MWWWYNRLDDQESIREANIRDLKRKIEAMKNQIKTIYDILEAMTNESKVTYLLNDYNRNDAQQEKLQKGDTAGDTDKKQVKLQKAGERNE
jgi:hypothetical protein